MSDYMSNDTQKKDFEVLSHTADLKIRVYGKNLEDLFHNALVGMFQVIKPLAQGCTYKQNRLICPALNASHEFTVQSHDINSLLVDFLAQTLALSDIYNEAYLDVTLTFIDSNKLNAIIYGVAIQGYEVVEIKAVTYHDLDIKQINGRWQTDIVFDI